METTLVLVKPDGVQRGLIGQIISRFEAKGLQLAALKLIQPSQTLLETHYAVHKERPFFGSLTEFMSSGPIVVSVLEGYNAIQKNRDLMGATNPAEAKEGTIRKDFADNIEINTVHGSDGPETAAMEIAYFFPEIDLIGGQR